MKTYKFTFDFLSEKTRFDNGLTCYAIGHSADHAQENLIETMESEGIIFGNILTITRTK